MFYEKHLEIKHPEIKFIATTEQQYQSMQILKKNKKIKSIPSLSSISNGGDNHNHNGNHNTSDNHNHNTHQTISDDEFNNIQYETDYYSQIPQEIPSPNASDSEYE